MTEEIKYLNLALEGWGVIFCLIAIFVILVGTRLEKKNRRYFLAIFGVLAVDLLANICGVLVKGKEGALFTVFVYMANFCEYFFGYLLSFLLTIYLLSHIVDFSFPFKKDKSLLYVFPIVILAVSVILLVVSQFTGLFYYFDETNVYHRGNFFWLSQGTAIISLVFNLIILFVFRKKLRSRVFFSFIIYNLLPVAGLIGQLFSYGLYLLLPATTAAAMLLFFFILKDQSDRIVQREIENTELQVSIMLSQIQPHFLYNSLTSIAMLCEKNPSQAKKATIAFAEYLRVNMDSLKSKRPVPFEKELEHVKTYMMLEKLRFGEHLNIVYDIKATNFYVPPLSLQPLVENAVKHGIGMKQDSGTIVIESREEDNAFIIKVKDDGIGFIPERIIQDDKQHVGIENVRKRLKDIAHADLLIESQLNVGTTVIITIPKEENSK